MWSTVPERYKPTGEKPRRVLFTDIETFSATDIKTAGAYRYIEDPEFEIIMLQYAWNDEPVRVLDLTEVDYDIDLQNELQNVLAGLKDPGTIKVAHNTSFERNAYRKHFGFYQPPEEWVDTMILCAMNGLPMNLDAAGAALQLPEQKIKEGTALINYFCKPCKPTVANGGRTRNWPRHDPDRWERFKKYGGRDVEVMRVIYKMFANTTTITDAERSMWALDNRINERGVLIDMELAEAAMAVNDAFTTEHSAELQRLTGLDNPNSVAQLKDWLAAVGIECESLNKTIVSDLMTETHDKTIRRVLELRQLLGKTSTTKYKAMTTAACDDDRVRGLLQYYGAGRTGRWAGRLVQVQNLPQNHLAQIDKVRELVRQRDLDTLELCFDSVPDVLSQLIRTAFVAKEQHTFLVADYSAIEARVIAYLAGEQWRMDVFAGSGKIYETSYARAFNVPVESVKKGSPERQKGKIMELALGYGGGVGALKAFGADKLGLSDAELQDLVDKWRFASPTIPRLWRRVEDAARAALENPGRKKGVALKVYDPERARANERRTGAPTGSYSDWFNDGAVCVYWRDKHALRCQLPSGRILTYWGARIDEGGIVFMGQNQTTRKWEKTDTWGGKLVENIVQAFARDCLTEAMIRLDDAGYGIVFHVHDEIVAEMPDGSRWEDMAAIMGRPIDWAPGLLLRADGYDTKFYMKD
jgi:DNA polymerase